jgi:hypothetical protein
MKGVAAKKQFGSSAFGRKEVDRVLWKWIAAFGVRRLREKNPIEF